VLPDDTTNDAGFQIVLQSFGGGTVNFTSQTRIKNASANGIVYDITCGSSGINTIPANSTLSVRCKSGTECDVFVFFYHNPPLSSSTNGDLPSILVDEGWTAASCAPTFTLTEAGASGCVYKQVAFRKILGDGVSDQIVTGSIPLKFLQVVVVPKVVCNNAFNEAQCAATHKVAGKTSTCAFNDGTCGDLWCPRSSATAPPAAPQTTDGGAPCPAANTF